MILYISKTSNPVVKQNPFAFAEEGFVHHEALSEVCGLTADLSSGIQAVNDIAVSMFEKEHSDFSGLDMNINNLATGAAVTTIGCLNISFNKGAAKISRKTGDDEGFAQNFVKMAVIGPIEVARGVINTTKSAVSLATTETKTPFTTNLIKGLSIASFVGSSAWSVVLGGASIASIMETRSVAKAFNKEAEAGDTQAFNHLKSMLIVSSGERKKVLEGLFQPKQEEPWYKRVLNVIADGLLGEKDTKEILAIKEAFQNIHKNPRAALELLPLFNIPIEEKALSEEESKVEEHLNEVFKDHKLDPLDKRKLLTLALHTYQIDIKHLKQKKEAIFVRMMGSKTEKLIAPLLKKEASEILPAQLKEIITSAKKSLFDNMAITASIITACILNVIVGAIAQTVTGGVFFFVQLALNLVISTIWLGIDGHQLYQAYKENHPNWKHRLLIALGTLSMVIISSIVASLASSVSNLAITAALTVAWLFLILYGMYGWRKVSKKEIKDIQAEI